MATNMIRAMRHWLALIVVSTVLSACYDVTGGGLRAIGTKSGFLVSTSYEETYNLLRRQFKTCLLSSKLSYDGQLEPSAKKAVLSAYNFDGDAVLQVDIKRDSSGAFVTVYEHPSTRSIYAKRVRAWLARADSCGEKS